MDAPIPQDLHQDLNNHYYSEYSEELVLSKNNKTGTTNYNRSNNPYSRQLCEQLERSYDIDRKSFICCSGMNAIYLAVTQLAASSMHALVYSEELYCDTPKVLSSIASRFHLLLCSINVTRPAEIQSLFNTKLRGKNVILFVESCSNPNGYIFDFSIVPSLRKSVSKLSFVIDNTWLTSLVFNPFQHGADVVVISLTKYYGGGVAIGGAIVACSSLIAEISEASRLMGQHVSPHNCRLISNGMQSMQQRLCSSYTLTLALLKHLSTTFAVPIIHPSLPSHVSHELAKKYFKNDLGPSVFTFHLKVSSTSAARRALQSSRIEYQTSFGSKLTRSDPWPYQEGDVFVCRLAVGFEDEFDRVTKGFAEIVAAANRSQK